MHLCCSLPASGSSAGGAVPPRAAASAAKPAHAHNGWVSLGNSHVPDTSIIINADELAGAPLLPGDVQIMADIKAYVRWVDGVRCFGYLSATSYALRFTPLQGRVPPQMAHLPASFYSVPMASVRRVERPRVREGAPLPHIDIVCKDARTFCLGFDDSPSASASATAEKIGKNVREPTDLQTRHVRDR